jgi:hypothetical protein
MPLGVVPSDPATIAALRAFGLRVNQIHARQLARAEARDGLIARPSPEESRSETPSEDAPGLSGTPRLRLRGVLDRMSVSASWKVEQDSWRVGIRLRYARSVEFDPATQSYALIEAREITPTARFRIVAIGRSTRVVVRRTGYGMWEKALITPPSRWLFVDRPNRIEEAQRRTRRSSSSARTGRRTSVRFRWAFVPDPSRLESISFDWNAWPRASRPPAIGSGSFPWGA